MSQRPGLSQRNTGTQSYSQPGPSSENSQLTQLSEEDFDDLVSNVVQYILVQDHHKHPIRQLDIKKNVLKERAKHYKNVMHKAREVIKQIYGFRLVEVEPGSSKSYILINNLTGLFNPTKRTEPQYVLLLVVLSLIFMCGGCVTDEVMWRFLARLRMFEVNVQNSYFGDVQRLMTQEFIRKLYLKYVRIPGTDPAKFEFRWGRRAEEEVDKKVLLKFVGKMFDQDDLSVWTTQYEEAGRPEPAKLMRL